MNEQDPRLNKNDCDNRSEQTRSKSLIGKGSCFALRQQNNATKKPQDEIIPPSENNGQTLGPSRQKQIGNGEKKLGQSLSAPTLNEKEG